MKYISLLTVINILIIIFNYTLYDKTIKDGNKRMELCQKTLEILLKEKEDLRDLLNDFRQIIKKNGVKDNDKSIS